MIWCSCQDNKLSIVLMDTEDWHWNTAWEISRIKLQDIVISTSWLCTEAPAFLFSVQVSFSAACVFPSQRQSTCCEVPGAGVATTAIWKFQNTMNNECGSYFQPSPVCNCWFDLTMKQQKVYFIQCLYKFYKFAGVAVTSVKLFIVISTIRITLHVFSPFKVFGLRMCIMRMYLIISCL